MIARSTSMATILQPGPQPLSAARSHARPPEPPLDGPVPSRGEAHRAVVYGPAGEGHLRRTLRLPCDVRAGESLLTPGGSNAAYVTVHHGAAASVDVIGPLGEARANCPLPPGSSVRFMAANDQSHRLYVQTEEALLAFDTGTGQEVGRVDGQHVYRESNRVALLPSGGLVLGRQHELCWFDDDLHEVRRRPMAFPPQCVRALEDGSILAWDRQFGGVAHVAADGTAWLERRGERVTYPPPPPSLGPDGRLWYAEGVGEEHEVHRYDPVTHADQTMHRGRPLISVIPLATDRFVAVGRERPSVDVRAPGHPEPLRHFAFGWSTRMGPTLVAEDGRQAWMVRRETINVHDWKGTQGSVLYRLDLEEKPDARPAWLPSLPSWGWTKTCPEPLYSRADGGILPVALADGRVVVFAEGEATLLASDGQTSASFRDVKSLREALGPQARQAGRMVYSIDYSPPPAVASLEDWLAEGARFAHLGWTPPPPAPGASTSAPRADLGGGTVEISGLSTLETARQELGRDPGEALRALAEKGLHKPPSPVGDGVADFWDGSQARAVVQGERVTLTRSDGLSTANEVQLDGDRVTAMLPLSSGEHRYLAVGTRQGRLVWMNGDSGEGAEVTSVPFGQPITGIDLAPDNRLLVAGTGDELMIFEPHLARSEALRGAGSGGAGPAPRGSGIQVENDHVTVGGVRVPRRKTPDPPSS